MALCIIMCVIRGLLGECNALISVSRFLIEFVCHKSLVRMR